MVHPVRGSWLLVFLCWVVGMGLPVTLLAQRLKSQETFPPRPHQNEWYFNDVTHKAWIFQGDDWQLVPVKDCRTVEHCNGHVIIKDGHTYSLATAMGKLVVTQAPRIHCLYSFVVVGGRGHLDYLLDRTGDTLTAVVNNCKIYQDTLEGMPVYCFPAYSPGLENYSCTQLRNWGMMDEEGRWRIEPMFDKPFNFQDGMARVWYKGMPRRINAQGAFLEDAASPQR